MELVVLTYLILSVDLMKLFRLNHKELKMHVIIANS